MSKGALLPVPDGEDEMGDVFSEIMSWEGYFKVWRKISSQEKGNINATFNTISSLIIVMPDHVHEELQ